MKFTLVLLKVLTASVIGLSLLAFASVATGVSGTSVGEIMQLFVVSTACVGGLAGLWAAMAGRMSLWRYVIVVMITVAVAAIGKRWQAQAVVIPLFLHATATMVPLFVARMAGYTICDIGPRESRQPMSSETTLLESPRSSPGATTAHSRFPQWSLWSLFSTVTTVAMLMGLLSTMRAVGSNDVTDDYYSWEGIVFVSIAGLLASSVLWATLTRKDVTSKLALLPLFYFVGCYTLSLSWKFAGTSEAAFMLFFPTLWFAAVGIVLRMTGFRLQRQCNPTRA